MLTGLLVEWLSSRNRECVGVGVGSRKTSTCVFRTSECSSWGLREDGAFSDAEKFSVPGRCRRLRLQREPATCSLPNIPAVVGAGVDRGDYVPLSCDSTIPVYYDW